MTAPTLAPIDETHCRAKEAAFDIGVSVSTVYRLCAAGKIPHVHVGGSVWIPRSVLAALPRKREWWE